MEAIATSNVKNSFEMVLKSASELPFVRIERSDFLRKELIKFCSDSQVEAAISANPASAGIEIKLINEIAKKCISFETNKVSAISFASSIPGDKAMLGTMVADTVQYFGHVLRILQKLIYLYGWEELIDSQGNMDDDTANLLTLFLGVMFGAKAANNTIAKLSASAATRASKTIAAKALTKGTLYPIIKKISATLGIHMTKEIFANNVAKTIPVIGAIASGGITYATYKPMALKLQKYLQTLKWADPSYYISQ